jgi:glycosyltransferase involved in cell wall biosynthesis
MKRILMIYGNELFDSDLEEKSIAGTQTAFIELSRAFEATGCNVTVLTQTDKSLTTEFRIWRNIKEYIPIGLYDLLIINVSPYLLHDFKNVTAKKKILWIHNEAKYLLYWNRLKYILRYLPIIVFSGKYHSSTLPFFIPTGGRRIITFGLSPAIFEIHKVSITNKEKKVFFTSNPLRSLRWLVDIWVKYIHPVEPTASLHIFSNWKTYGAWGESVQNRMKAELEYVESFKDYNIFLRDVLPKKELFQELKTGRAMFYRGDKAETFCLSIAEGQALGLPAVVCDLGSMKERVENGLTGVVAKNDEEFIEAALNILNDDTLFHSMSSSALKKYSTINWKMAANKFLGV